MKIAVSSTEQSQEAVLDPRFGRCEFFMIYNTETKENKRVKNIAITATGGAGIEAANQLCEEEIEVVITGELGPNAFKILEKVGIKAFSCAEISVVQALEKYQNGQLTEIVFAKKQKDRMKKD